MANTPSTNRPSSLCSGSARTTRAAYRTAEALIKTQSVPYCSEDSVPDRGLPSHRKNCASPMPNRAAMRPTTVGLQAPSGHNQAKMGRAKARASNAKGSVRSNCLCCRVTKRCRACALASGWLGLPRVPSRRSLGDCVLGGSVARSSASSRGQGSDRFKLIESVVLLHVQVARGFPTEPGCHPPEPEGLRRAS